MLGRTFVLAIWCVAGVATPSWASQPSETGWALNAGDRANAQTDGTSSSPLGGRPKDTPSFGKMDRRGYDWRTSPASSPKSERFLLLEVHTAVSMPSAPLHRTSASVPAGVDLSGKWDILEVEDDKRYQATLDQAGNGPYTQQGGQFVTTKFADRLWQGSWHQPGNDREGGFELLLSEDGKEAKGVWWYTRVGRHTNIPPREHGGTYHWKRITPVPSSP